MANLKAKDAVKMSKEDREAKLKELKMELIRSNVTAQKSNAKTRQIKRSIARLHTITNSNKSNSEVLKK
ncbi:MAG: 50S ribosomal protein L29 [Nanoarchaeota archaeon]|nr:50S ribosomal protein L29 [Nanoarchaeota archaeon]